MISINDCDMTGAYLFAADHSTHSNKGDSDFEGSDSVPSYSASTGSNQYMDRRIFWKVILPLVFICGICLCSCAVCKKMCKKTEGICLQLVLIFIACNVYACLKVCKTCSIFHLEMAST